MTGTTIHASCVAIGGRALIILGRSGSGKSDLALRLIDRGAVLISDDYTVVTEREGRVFASAPPTIAGRLEVRGIGILPFPFAGDAPVALVVDLERTPVRMPDPATRKIAGVAVPLVTIAAFESSAPIKVEHALSLFGTAP